MDSSSHIWRRLCAAAVFLSAFLLFQIQPILAKLILPWFGGAAAVWVASLAFYQSAYLLGNLYAHLLLRRGLLLSSRLHALALFASLLLLPVVPSAFWKSNGAADPLWRILGLLAATAGLPFLLLSATSPLLQGWYGAARAGKNPYRFYSLSNAGSLLALLSYPFLVEPLVPAHAQAILWSLAYAGFVFLCAAIVWRRPAPAAAPGLLSPAPPWTAAILWFFLAATASLLLLSIGNHISQNIAAVPLLWIAPLSIYLLTLVLCFDSPRWYRRRYFLPLLAAALGAMTYAISGPFESASPAIQILLFLGGLFICCMACHGELARLKPHPEFLTAFYLALAAGGAAGGIFAAVIAPRLFYRFYELPLGLALCPLCVLAALLFSARSSQSPLSPAARSFATAATFVLLLFLAYQVSAGDGALLTIRNFYGVLRVGIVPAAGLRPAVTQLKHGAIVHGEEIIEPARNDVPTAYYGEHSGAGIALLLERQRGPLQVGVIGLGAGTLARYGQRGDRYVFYEINPQVIDLARNLFDFLRQSEAQIEIVPGDARLSLENQPARRFDLLLLDAFSGDAVPVHLLTRQAFQLYYHRLKPGGLLAVHVTNRFLDLPRLVAAEAAATGARALLVSNAEDAANAVYASQWMLLDLQDAPNTSLSALFEDRLSLPPGTALRRPSPDAHPWTDDYSNLLQIVKW